jgi:hypothetical protein
MKNMKEKLKKIRVCMMKGRTRRNIFLKAG